jgi:hypothetical protein
MSPFYIQIQNNLFMFTPIHTYLQQRISTQPIPRPTILKTIPGTQKRAISSRGIHTPRIPAIPTIALAAILYTPIGETRAVRGTHLERHGRVVVVHGAGQGADVRPFCLTAVVGISADRGFDRWGGLRGCC